MEFFMKFVSVVAGYGVGALAFSKFGLVGIPVGLVAGFGLYFWYANKKAKREAEELALARAKAEAEELQRRRAQLETDERSLVETIRSLQGITKRAEERLALAQQEFSERAYAPFWDAVEEVLKLLAEYDKELRYIEYKAKELDSLARTTNAPSPSKRALAALPKAVQASTDLRALVRTAQRDFEFAQIYEARRTNRILIDGFETVASAIEGLGGRIEKSIASLQSGSYGRR